MGAGIVCGGLAGATAFAAVSLAAGEGERLSWEALWIGLFFGAPLGGVTAPVLSWLLLRRVPLGQMFLVCSIGTSIGGAGGWFTGTTLETAVNRALLGAFVACLVAAIVLRARMQRA
jgi:hypothetical protein